jgi:putative aldouronate transport system substrate-binding protein
MEKGTAEELFGKGDFLVFTQAIKGNSIKAVEMYTEKHKAEDEPFDVGEIIMQPKYIVTAHTAGSMFAIPKADCDPDKAMQYLNLMHSDPTLVNLMLFGVEGKNYTKLDGKKVTLTDTPWYTVHGGAWTVGDVTLQYVLENEDPEKNDKLIEFAKDATETCCLGFRLNKKKIKDECEAVNAVVKEYFNPLLCGVVDPDDPEKGIETAKKALKDAGIEKIVETAQKQYEEWKNAQW